MKYIKQYEGYIKNDKLPDNGLKIGDYVLMKHSDLNPIRDEINVYEIVSAFEYKKEKKDSTTRYQFKLKKYGQSLGKSEIWKYPQHLEFLTNNEDDIESALSQRKYNL